VAGIAAEWGAARSPGGYARAAEYASRVPADVPPPAGADALPTAVLVASAAMLAVRHPRLMAKVAAAAAGVAATGAAVGAAGVRNAARVIERIHAADEQLRAQQLLNNAQGTTGAPQTDASNW
jgi:hypothetical protein